MVVTTIHQRPNKYVNERNLMSQQTINNKQNQYGVVSLKKLTSNQWQTSKLNSKNMTDNNLSAMKGLSSLSSFNCSFVKVRFHKCFISKSLLFSVWNGWSDKLVKCKWQYDRVTGLSDLVHIYTDHNLLMFINIK